VVGWIDPFLSGNVSSALDLLSGIPGTWEGHRAEEGQVDGLGENKGREKGTRLL